MAAAGEPPTVATTDENSSQPSTSAGTNENEVIVPNDSVAEEYASSESDASIGWADYERRKDYLIKKVVLCEQQMSRIKVTGKFTRLKHYEKRKEDIKNGTDSEFLARVAAMEKELQKEQDKAETHISLELASLNRVHEGEMDHANRGYRDRAQYRKAQWMYDAQLKLDKIVDRIWREDEVRSDVRIFIGDDVPDEWLDEFVKAYVDEQEELENSPEAVRERNLRRYRTEVGDSLDTGQSLYTLMENAEPAKFTNESSLPKKMLEDAEKRREKKKLMRENEKMQEKRLEKLVPMNFGRVFKDKEPSYTPEEYLEDDEEEESDVDIAVPISVRNRRYEEAMRRIAQQMKEVREIMRREEATAEMEKEEEDKKLKELKERARGPLRINIEKKLLNSMDSAEVKAMVKEKKAEAYREKRLEVEEQKKQLKKMMKSETERLQKAEMRNEKLAYLEEEMRKLHRWQMLSQKNTAKSEESASDEEMQDLEVTVRHGVRAILATFGRPSGSAADCAQGERRVGRLKTTLKTILNLKKDMGADPELRTARNKMMECFTKAANKGHRKADGSLVDQMMADMAIEERVRETSLVDGVVSGCLKRPMAGPRWADDADGRVGSAVRNEKIRRRDLANYLAEMRKTRASRKKIMNGEKGNGERVSEKKEETGKKKKPKKSSKQEVKASARKSAVQSRQPQPAALSEQEKEEKARKLREIRAVIEGRDPTTIDHAKEKEKEKLMEMRDKVKEKKGGVIKNKKKKVEEKNVKNNGKQEDKEFARVYDSDSDDYGSPMTCENYDSVPAYRRAVMPKKEMRLQLSNDQILKDLFRSGALRQRTTHGDHVESMDRERRERLLAEQSPTGAVGQEWSSSRMHLLSPRSQTALANMPDISSLTRSERRALLEELPSTSKESYDSSEDEEEDEEYDEESEEEEELSEGWELEEDEEQANAVMEEEARDEAVEDEQVMEVDDEAMEASEQAVTAEEVEEARSEETRDVSPPNTVPASPILYESAVKNKKKNESAPRINGFSRAGTTVG